jgi:hypothetical protein
MSHYSLDALILQNTHSLRELQRLTGSARTTIVRHRRKLRQRYPDNKELRRTSDDAGADNQLALPDVLSETATDGGAVSSPAPSSSNYACEAYREQILTLLDRGYSGTSIWQELVERYSVPFGYQSIKRYIAKLRPVREIFNRIEGLTN